MDRDIALLLLVVTVFIIMVILMLASMNQRVIYIDINAHSSHHKTRNGPVTQSFGHPENDAVSGRRGHQCGEDADE
ncbi:hypothetical protein BV22DRAFT_1039278 [Leucogyrophana mollusca]|uniref:Uncharacterized protein n=1 Tax=Leucogyrophana mollusca TaxID=85980 RepID=A0ACB8B5X1_9AGAM|nr:hypothetical protein BV22DRAFT_1039278 [Leucogyrophana mollusca]